MKKEYCLDIENDVYAIGDLNLFLDNKDSPGYPAGDPMRPERPYFTGVIRQELQVGGESRPYLLYIPERYPISGAGVFLYPGNGQSCEAFLESGGWKRIAEENGVALIVLEPRPGGWSRGDIQSEVQYSEAVFKSAISRVYFSMNEATYYIMGFGAGAYPATAYALLNSALFAALCVDGDYHLHPDLLAQLGRVRSDRDAAKSKLDVAVPAWLVNRDGDDGGPVLESLKRAACARDTGLRNDDAAVYQQDPRRFHTTPDGLPMAEVWFSGKSSLPACAPEELNARMTAFALRFKRWLGIGNGDLRPARTWRDMGLKRFEAVVDGRLREWYVYEPSAHRADAAEKRPLVLAIHGYSCTGPLYAENSHWHEVAERRDFFVVYVSAFPSNKISGGRTVPLPTWNALCLPAGTDDMRYIRHVLDEVKAAYPVDGERVYVSGHSNGSLLTQQIMEEMPLEFAAFAPQGAQYHMDLGGDPSIRERRIPRDGHIRPVWLMMGEEDIGDAASLEPGTANDLFIGMMCDVNMLDRSRGYCTENGKYRTHTYPDGDRVPLLRFTCVRDLPHAYTPEMAYIFWDQFFSHFRRKADGSIAYRE